jgi:hypothetical protein
MADVLGELAEILDADRDRLRHRQRIIDQHPWP